MKKDVELEKLLKKNTPPKINADIRHFQIRQLTENILEMDYFPPQSYIGQILTQLSFISAWVWLIQAGMLFLMFFYVFRTSPPQMNALIFSLAPGLSLILVCELSKSFRLNIWEMEAACRYNLAQIFFFRLCILFGGDILVLTGALILYRMADGLLMQFCLFALMPFFLTSAVSLYVLRRIGNHCGSFIIAAVPLLTAFLVIWGLSFLNECLARLELSLNIPVFTILAFALFLYHAIRLCTRAHYLTETSPSIIE